MLLFLERERCLALSLVTCDIGESSSNGFGEARDTESSSIEAGLGVRSRRCRALFLTLRLNMEAGDASDIPLYN